jgi:lysophospholipid acyltransferase (LPLAT)-like uncharacterized protein
MLKKKLFRSWDRFLLPLPFGRGLFLFGEPITVSADASEADVEAKRLELEQALNRMTEEADERVKGEG